MSKQGETARKNYNSPGVDYKSHLDETSPNSVHTESVDTPEQEPTPKQIKMQPY